VKRHTPSEEEVRLFREAVGPVRTLEHDRHVPQTPGPAPVPSQRLRDERQVLRDLLSDGLDPADLETGEELVYLRPGLPYSLLRRLRRGQFSVGPQLDLHGLTVDEARTALGAFLHEVQRGGRRCVRIVHGKGLRSGQRGPVLKQTVNALLRRVGAVVAFHSARQVDGGTGAVYVLLAGK